MMAMGKDVYQSTTQPMKNRKHRDKSDLGSDFIAPDGGWGWIVCLAAGFSNFSIFPALQQYGFIYRLRMLNLGFDSKYSTTIINVVIAMSSLVGIVNGALFRRFTFRQVAFVGGLLCFLGIFLSAFCLTFVQYLIWFSCIYGIGLGLSTSANSLAVNTYFKINRRRATGFSWGITGLGSIIFPHISILLLNYYGAQGAILIYSSIALNSILCAITLQPVLRHARTTNIKDNEENKNENNINKSNGLLMEQNITYNNDYECKYCQLKHGRKKRSIFSSQYLFNNDDPDKPGYEITEPATPMFAKANDGWFGSKQSLSSINNKYIQKKNSSNNELTIENNSLLNKPNYFNREREEIDRYTSKLSIYSINDLNLNLKHCTCHEEKILLQHNSDSKESEKNYINDKQTTIITTNEKQLSFLDKIVIFFDLDLLKDITFINLVTGIAIMMFTEMNFSILTPFILNNFNYTNKQISLVLSLLGCIDITVRFLAPFAIEKIKLNNRILFTFGIILLTVGRLLVVLTNSYFLLIIIFIIIGIGKAFRTIFLPLIIPSYVPLNRLPAASGLQLIFNSVFSLLCGPILGLITDNYGYKVTIHFMNIITIMAIILWACESYIRRLLTPTKTKIVLEA